MAIELVSTNVGLDGKRIDVKNNTKLKPSKDNFSFDKDGNISINLPKTIVRPDRLSPVKLNTKPEGSMQYLLNTAGNFPQSLKNLAVDYAQPFIHPINTFNAVKSMVVGFRELSNRNKFIKENPNTSPPKMTENMIMAEAVNAHFAERYGDWVGNETDDWDVIGNKFAKSFREDPAGVMADISGVMTLGTIGATKYAGRFGKIAQNISKNIDPVQGLFAGAGKSINAASGKLTGKGVGVLDEAFKAGEIGGEANKSFNLGQGNIFKEALFKAEKLTPTQAFKNYIEKLNKYSDDIKATYNDWIEGLPSSYIENLKTPALILREIDEIKYGKAGKQKRPFFNQTKEITEIDVEGGLINPKTNKPFTKPAVKTKNTKRALDIDVSELNKLETEVLEYANNPNFQNAQALAQLKLKLAKLKFTNPDLQKIQKNINKSIKEDLTLVDANTPRIMSDYSSMIDNLNELKYVVGDGSDANKFNFSAGINKAKQIIKEGKKGEKNIAEPILKKIESELIPELSGIELSDFLSPASYKLLGTGLLSHGGGVGISLFDQMEHFGGAANLIRNVSYAGIPLSSPRLMGNINNKMGLLSRYGVNTKNAGILSRKVLNPLSSSTEAPFGTGLDNKDLYNLFESSKTSETTPIGAGINNLFEYFNND